jgi:FADH2 O2-dependent halogenase
MWVIPFNNHSEATNPICSVGVMFESDKSPKTDTPPEEEFAEFCKRYPSIGKQFENAKAVRKWVSSPRIQYSSAKLFEGRYFALPHAAAFIDPLFSTGINLTAHAVNLVGDALLESFRTGTLQAARLRTAESQVLHKVKVYDRLVATSFKAFRSFEMWNAWFRIWEIGTYFNTLGAMRCILKYEQTGDEAFLRQRFDKRYASPLAYGVRGYAELFDRMSALVDQVDRGELEEAAAVDGMYAALARFDAMPSFISRRDRKDRTMGTFTLLPLTRMFLWGRTRGPADSRHYYGFSLATFCKMILKSDRSYRRHHAGVRTQPLRDMVLVRSSNEPPSQVGVPASAAVRAIAIPPREERALDGLAAANEAGGGTLHGGVLAAAARLAPMR